MIESLNNTKNTAIYVAAEESITLKKYAFENCNGDECKENIKEARCASKSKFFDVNIVDGSRRRILTSDDYFIVTITYKVNSDVYDSIVQNGTIFSDGSAFEIALAESMGVTTDKIQISDTSGTIELYIMVTETGSEDEDPMDDSALQELANLERLLVNAISAIAEELGIDTSSIVQAPINYCPASRTCNDRGTCNPVTGCCDCDTGFWGCNCETSVTCNNGTIREDTSGCFCTFPEYGARCQYKKDSCETCI